ncbi:biopolymer transporter ExbD [Blochmannia endosymbiont of Camponotus (Colobopsis) obliquus]|uniref:biopolymer transporter ExbD n=1 Tax=Blochmannia endosymbiont of Camponotus (Colobopsis) obliquus TaxID=1505597 RepID=UPI00061A6430|nr:biopolymer transporter ExbD [Blochmannia endosymbiont of Camponotus (Colobopsis) obliquus]AKC60500.1 protein tolR [Blochmannia endosymbiont of Camponotus (Colobopsis) obliquus]
MNYHKLRCRKVKSEINVVPFLDILLILVIILMITFPIIIQNIDIELPNNTNTITLFTLNDNSCVIVEVLGIGQYNLVVNNNRKKNVSYEQILREVRDRVSIDSNTTFLIGGSKNVVYAEIVSMLNLLQKAGIKSVGLMTKTI